MNVSFAYCVNFAGSAQCFQTIFKTYCERIRGFYYLLPEKNGEHCEHMYTTKGIANLNRVPTLSEGKEVPVIFVI
jgi:hypothetical protein